MGLIIIDSSIWIDHIRAPIPELVSALAQGRVLQHPFATAEVALGSFTDRTRVIAMLDRLAQTTVPPTSILLEFLDEVSLAGTGLGMVDTHLLLAARDESAQLWTRDKRLAAQAERLGLGYSPA